MSRLPQSWSTVAISEIATFNPKTVADDSLASAFSPMQFLGTRFRARMGYEERVWGDIKKSYVHFQTGDVIVAKVTPCFENGKAGVAPKIPNGIGAGSSEFCVFRPAEGIDERYLLAWLSTEDFRRRATVAMTGSVGLKRVPKAVFLDEQIPLAPAPEQRRIADKLDTVLTRVDAVQDRLARITPLLKRFRQSILAAATSGRLTEESRDQAALEAWRSVRLHEVVREMRNGLAAKPDESPEGNKILRIKAVRPGSVDDRDHRRLTITAKEAELYALQKGDLLFTRYNGSLDFVGVCALVRGDLSGYVYPDKLIRVRVDLNQVLAAYVELACSTVDARRQIEGFVKSSAGQKGIAGADLKLIAFQLPSIAEQAEIVRRVELLMGYADRLEVRLKAAQTAAERLTPTLLAKAFRGELVPQDPNDEPASELLRRLREQRAAQAPVKSKRGRKKLA